MKYFYFLLFLFTSNLALAHEDHMLGEGTLHLIYHSLFWILFAGVVYIGTQLYLSHRKKLNSKNR